MREPVIRIEKMAFGGAGFGRVDGKACFVPFAAPGDEARIRVAVEKGSYLEGELVDLITPSSQRVAPPCPIFGTCGGCSWQHLSYEAQLAAKGDIFAETLWRSGRVERECIEPVAAADEQYGYRTRVQFKLRWSTGRLHIGFYRKGSHFVVDIPGACAIAHPAINRVLAELRLLLADFPEPDRVPQIDAAVGDEGEVVLIVHYIGDASQETVAFFQRNRERLPSVNGLHLQCGRKSSIDGVFGLDSLSYGIPDCFLPELPEMRLSFSRGGFSQVNYRQNLELLRTVHDFASLKGGERLLDVYCGNGNFALPLAHFASEVVGIEEYEPSILDAERNAAANGIERARFACLDAVEGVRSLKARGERFAAVLLDPPRTGAKEAVGEIALLAPERIIYVSCDPTTLGRDLGLLRKLGYTVVRSRPVDMFPQTYHIESVTLLQRAG